jgi:hypothetical protein
VDDETMKGARAHFRAYRDPHTPNRCAELAGGCVARWLQGGGYLLTDGPPLPFGRPHNLIPATQAQTHQRRTLRDHEPLYLWRYPLAFRLQLWRQGWDIGVRHATLHTGMPGGAVAVRRECLHSALEDLIVATEPRVLVGPLTHPAPPAHLAQALRELHSWPLWYVDPAIAEHTALARLLPPRKQARLRALSTGGLLFQQLT